MPYLPCNTSPLCALELYLVLPHAALPATIEWLLEKGPGDKQGLIRENTYFLDILSDNDVQDLFGNKSSHAAVSCPPYLFWPLLICQSTSIQVISGLGLRSCFTVTLTA